MTNPDEVVHDDCEKCINCQLNDINSVLDMLNSRLYYLEGRFQEQTRLMTGLIKAFSQNKPPKCTKKKVNKEQ